MLWHAEYDFWTFEMIRPLTFMPQKFRMLRRMFWSFQGNALTHSRKKLDSGKCRHKCTGADLLSGNGGRGVGEGRGLYQQGKSQGNFGQFDIKLDCNYCQISTNCFELSSSLAVQKVPPRLQQLKVKRKHFFENLRRSPDKSLGIALKPPTTKVLVLTPRLRELSSRLSASLLEESLLLNFPSILSDRKSTSQGEVNI